MTSRSNLQSEYRKLPSVDAILQEPEVQLLIADYGQGQVTKTVRDLLKQARARIATGQSAPTPEQWVPWLNQQLVANAVPTLQSVINATGVIIHTNLGRAPLSRLARQAIQSITYGYSNLEYNLDAGARGSRYDHSRQLLCELTGAEDALVVNNNASAVYLVLTALCYEREVIISRGELVEIGGGFRIPDVLRQSGSRLVEVGTTNRTHLRDFAQAVTSQTAAIMRVHSSNFRQIGFVSQPSVEELAALAHSIEIPSNSTDMVHHVPVADNNAKVLLIDDLGSGTLLNTEDYRLAPEPMVQQSLAAGADIVTFSGDKLLGGPQAGIIVGRANLVGRIRRHPMARALRVDKMTLAGLDATLRSYQRGQAIAEIPIWQMIGATVGQLKDRATGWRNYLLGKGIISTVQEGESTVGGGSLPSEILPTALLSINVAQPDDLSSRLRGLAIPIICRIQKSHLLFDPRTILPEQDTLLLESIVTILGSASEDKSIERTG